MSETRSAFPTISGPTVIAGLGGLALFLLILAAVYLPRRPAPLTVGSKTPTERLEILAEVRAHDRELTDGYAWIDQSKGVVRLPLDRAIELTIQELNAQRRP